MLKINHLSLVQRQVPGINRVSMKHQGLMGMRIGAMLVPITLMIMRRRQMGVCWRPLDRKKSGQQAK